MLLMASLVRTSHSIEGQRAAKPKNLEPRHMTSEEMAAFLSGNISCTERELMLRHLADCHDCRKTAAEIVLSQAAVRDPDGPQL